MGQLKQLLPLGDRPAVRHCLEKIFAAGIDEIVIVLGVDGEKILPAFEGLTVKVAWNRIPESDMAASLRAGLASVGETVEGILVCLSDLPLVSARTIRAIRVDYLNHPDSIIIPAFRGKRGHPNLFPRPCLAGVGAGMTLRDVKLGFAGSVRTIDVPDEGILLDMDTMDDYRAICDKYRERLQEKDAGDPEL
jgi:molybdenum cofactor cytidylyltransferase